MLFNTYCLLMNYDKLKNLLAKNGLSAAKASMKVGRTEAWFHKAVKNETMTIADLEKLLSLCGTSLQEFFNGEASVYAKPKAPEAVAEKEEKYGKHTEELLETQRELIKTLKAQNEEYRRRLEERKGNGAGIYVQK